MLRSIVFCWPVAVLGLILSGSPTSAGEAGRTAKSSEAAEVNGTWSPIVTLRDTTDRFKGTADIPRPEGGWWVAPIHANLLASGKVVITGWNRPVEKFCRNHQGRLYGTSFLLDVNALAVQAPTTLQITPLDEQPRKKGDVLYCSGHCPLADGRVLYMGGARYKNLGEIGDPGDFNQEEFGLNYARLYDPKTNKFTRVPWTNPGGPAHPDPRPDDWRGYQTGDMWYPTNTRLPGGKMLTHGGLARWISILDSKRFDFQNRSVTIFDPAAYDKETNPWTVWVHHDKSPREVANDVFDYAHAFVLPKPVMVGGAWRHVAVYGGVGSDPRDGGNGSYVAGITLLSLDEKVPEEKRFVRPANAARPRAGMLNETTAALTADGCIAVIGGGNNGKGEGQRIDVYDPYKDRWHSVDMKTTRQKPSSTLLPDGTILIINGEEFFETRNNVGDRTRPSLFDPRTRALTELARWQDDNDVRGYHAVALLLKDGRVLVGGGRIYEGKPGSQVGEEGAYRIGCERPELRVFSPPYLFRGPRPELVEPESPKVVALGSHPFVVKYRGAALRGEKAAVLMALGAYTHSFDQNQRIVPLETHPNGPGEITVTPPDSSWVAPEGDYNLFLISDRGVPSVAASVRIVSP